MTKYILLILTSLGLASSLNAQQDKYAWLEDVEGKDALEFVNKQNRITFDKLSKEKYYSLIYNKSLEIFNSPEKIVYPGINGKYVYNFWKDKDHERGIWRRCLLHDYKNGNLNWETLLDIDALARKDNIKWVFKGAIGLYPSYNRFLIQLSKGGGDAVVIKEFDTDKKQFTEGGFYIEEAKGTVSFGNENTVVVSTDFGEGTMTASGYPLQTRLWKRGTLLKDAQLIYEGQASDLGNFNTTIRNGNKSYPYIERYLTSFTSKKIIWADDALITLDIPEDCSVNGILSNQLIAELKSDWQVNGNTYKTGTLLSLDFTELLKNNRQIKIITEPDSLSSISGTALTKNHLLVNVLSNISCNLYACSFSDGKWSNKKVAARDLGQITINSADEFSEDYFFTFEDFITPPTLYVADAGSNKLQPLQSLPSFFDADKYEVRQFRAKSKDGTLVPYFVVHAKNIDYNSSNPTLLYAYGGFEVSEIPNYLSAYGSWLDNGGVYVLANIRGGGEFGPKWHQQGLKEKRQNVYDDFFAVSEDLIAQKITSPKHLGIWGGSNGGLLVGVAFTQRPDLYNAVFCAVPLLDMQRYHKLLAGASWIGEYGDPDIAEEWEYIQKYSPYHNLKAGMQYPEVFFFTSTKDDRVHPGHARKMAAKMIDMGYPVYYYENTEGGHAGASTNEQQAKHNAMMFSYFLNKLK